MSWAGHRTRTASIRSSRRISVSFPRRKLSAKFCPKQGLLWSRRGYSGSAATGALGHGSRAARSEFQACKGAFMLHSRDRILTTHVGSLPRNEVLTDLLIRREAGEAIDPAPWPREMDRAVRSTVDAPGGGRHRHRQRRRAAAGRLPDLHPRAHVGLRRQVQAQGRQGLPGGAGADRDVPAPLPAGEPRSPTRRRRSPRCAISTPSDIKEEIARFKPCVARRRPFAEMFATAPSPGIVATTMMNAHYKSHEDY